MIKRQSSASLEFVNAPIRATTAGAPTDISGDSVEFAFVGSDEPQETWLTGEWASTTPLTDGSYIARCLVGPGGAVTLTPATYTVLVKVTDDPEIPVIPCGYLYIT